VNTREELLQRARYLRNAAPQAFMDFRGTFEKYAEESYQKLVNTTVDLQLLQGHAQQCNAILQILNGAKNG
jgi:hypothetical protein